MGKYDRLEAHLRRQKTATYEMTFRDIERVLGDLLPKSADRPDWWSDGPDPAALPVQCRAWFGARYRATLIEGGERVRFSRIDP